MLVASQTAESPQHSIRHVICYHPGTDQNTPERHFIGPLSTISDLGKTGSEKKERRLKFGDQIPICILFPLGPDTHLVFIVDYVVLLVMLM